MTHTKSSFLDCSVLPLVKLTLCTSLSMQVLKLMQGRYLSELKTQGGEKLHRVCQGFGQAKLGKTWLWELGFRLKPIFPTASAASKNKAFFKRGQK